MWGRNNHRAAQEEEEEKCWPEGERDCELKGELVGGFKLEHNTHNVYVCHATPVCYSCATATCSSNSKTGNSKLKQLRSWAKTEEMLSRSFLTSFPQKGLPPPSSAALRESVNMFFFK